MRAEAAEVTMTEQRRVSEDQPRRRPRDRKQQILASARALFIERGYPNVSMTLIAEQVGITSGALYRHFDNKAVILQEVLEDTFGYLDLPPRSESLEEAVDIALTAVLDRPFIAALWGREVAHLPDDARREMRARMRAWAFAFVPLLKARRPALDDGQAELLALALQSVQGFVPNHHDRSLVESRLPVARAASLALVEAQLVPTGELTMSCRSPYRPVSMREQILLAARDLFAHRGFIESSMTSIGAAADVTAANLYGYYASKADLQRAVYDRFVHVQWHCLELALRFASSPREALERLVEGHLELLRLWSATRIDVTSDPDIVALARTSGRELVGEWVAVLRRLRPGMEYDEAHARVLMGLTIANDLNQTPRVARRETFGVNLRGVLLAVLVDG